MASIHTKCLMCGDDTPPNQATLCDKCRPKKKSSGHRKCPRCMVRKNSIEFRRMPDRTLSTHCLKCIGEGAQDGRIPNHESKPTIDDMADRATKAVNLLREVQDFFFGAGIMNDLAGRIDWYLDHSGMVPPRGTAATDLAKDAYSVLQYLETRGSMNEFQIRDRMVNSCGWSVARTSEALKLLRAAGRIKESRAGVLSPVAETACG